MNSSYPSGRLSVVEGQRERGAACTCILPRSRVPRLISRRCRCFLAFSFALGWLGDSDRRHRRGVNGEGDGGTEWYGAGRLHVDDHGGGIPGAFGGRDGDEQSGRLQLRLNLAERPADEQIPVDIDRGRCGGGRHCRLGIGVGSFRPAPVLSSACAD
jgi:hypothetical protein